MRALVVYESMFGCTRDVALAIGRGLAASTDVDVVEVGAARDAVDGRVDLVVVGGPTHAFGMSRPRTRADAHTRPGHLDGSTDVGIREWLESVDEARAGTRAATFDTRVGSPRVPGSAANAMHRRMRRVGFTMIVPPESFWVTGTPALLPGETARAEAWGAGLGRALTDLGHRPDRGVPA